MTRKEWLAYLYKVVDPILRAPSLKSLPVEQQVERSACTWMEAVGRLICGIAPWLESESENADEADRKSVMQEQCRKLIARQFDPISPDYIQFTPDEPQFLVDLAFLAEGMLRAPKELIEKQDAKILASIMNVMQASRKIQPYNCNWLLFSAMVEALLLRLTGEYNSTPIETAFNSLDSWYKGDGIYGDGPELAVDYYNSYVIQPMLVELAEIFPDLCGAERADRIRQRAARYAIIQERSIAPDGTFFAVGRSICYRAGAFHHLANMTLLHALPDGMKPGAVREAIGAVIDRTLTDNNFRQDGLLTIGLSGSQPALGEPYISTGSLYLCTTAFLPLGLSPQDPFWTDAPAPWTQKRLWSGENMTRDAAYHE